MKKLTFLLLFTFFITGCSSESYRAEKAFYQATKVLKGVTAEQINADPASSLAPAIASFEKVVEQYPTSPKAAESLFKIADLQFTQKRFKEARETLKKVLPNFSRGGDWAPNARFRIAQLYEAEGRWTEAEKAYWEVADYHPVHQRGFYAPLHILLHYKQLKDTSNQNIAYEKALEHYEQALDAAGPIQASASIKNAMALVHLAQNHKEKAREEWLSIAQDFPSSPFAPLAFLTLAELSWKDQNPEQAFSDYERFFRVFDRHPLAGRTAVHAGMLRLFRKEFPEARDWFERALRDYFKTRPSEIADIKLLIGKTYQDEGKWEDAERYYGDLETNYSMTAAALQIPFARFLHYKATGDVERANQTLDQAIAHYKKLVAEDPHSKIAQYAKRFMFQAYTQKEDWDQVMLSADQELQGETSEDGKGRWLFLKALITENRLKDRERALALYQDFLAQYPGHPLSHMAKSHQEVLAKA
ncbi:MAG: tetratricopeptide repeat protein [Candidatus Omnitrophica bacterium]|nr:tetratricopeptide repeat protein [Candidatus Omnitrophota bacterium]